MGGVNLRDRPLDREVILNDGGETKVVLDIEGKQYVGVAICSVKDNFCRRTGRKMAIFRAFKEYREQEKKMLRKYCDEEG